ncbi:hypothetical protein [Sphingomonas sp. G-3-2-10]|uniref:hypothetical protein n=1 Tax=Sphingomonas sp. G-3-2-10 TaxID=2728838 RepID=UPI00146F19A1|nr:hypothetical protein [Sphingomonas sp. G-3-2-10]NML06169.1 hypothetical protein [Sphingomonas sp. G-3-2-10]
MAIVERLQKQILREWERWESTPERRDAVTRADAAMTRLLPAVMLTREELAATATMSSIEAYPVVAAARIVDELGNHESMFAPPADDREASLERLFALEVVERALRAAKDDKDYAILLTLDIAIEVGRALAGVSQQIDESTETLSRKIDDGLAAVQKSLGGEYEKLSQQALRGAVARFITFRPNAPTSEVVEAVDRFIPEYDALRERVALLDANDNRLKGAQQAASEALDRGDLDAARQHLREAVLIQGERTAEAVRQEAQTLSELASADLLALDWQSAYANWKDAGAKLTPYDAGAAGALMAAAGLHLRKHGLDFGSMGALSAAAAIWRLLRDQALARGDTAGAAGCSNNLGDVLSSQGERAGGEAGLAFLAEAANVLREALSLCEQISASELSATLQVSLGNALRELGSRTSDKAGFDLLMQAAATYQAAMKVYTKKAHPLNWAGCNNNLGIALEAAGDRMSGSTGLSLITAAIAASIAALSLGRSAFDEAQWAIFNTNFGNALCARAQRTSLEVSRFDLALAALAFRDTLAAYTEVETPASWAMTQNNLGIILRMQGAQTPGDEGVELIWQAVHAFEAALRIRTEKAVPFKWAMTQNNLGAALGTLGQRVEGEAGIEILARGIAAFKAAMTVYDPMSAQWAMTGENIARMHEVIAERSTDPLPGLKAAEQALIEALSAFSPEHMAYYHNKASASLARVREKIAAIEA